MTVSSDPTATDLVLSAIDDVLGETIDGAYRDWSVSPDAMRWAPEPLDQPELLDWSVVLEPPTPIDWSAFVDAFTDFARVLDEWADLIVEFAALMAALDEKAEVSAMHTAYDRRRRARQRRTRR